MGPLSALQGVEGGLETEKNRQALGKMESDFPFGRRRGVGGWILVWRVGTHRLPIHRLLVIAIVNVTLRGNNRASRFVILCRDANETRKEVTP